MMSMSLIVILFCVTLVEGINIARIDGEQDLVVYINGLPLMAGGAYNMPAYQQLWNVMTNRGEIIPASVRYEKVGYNGRLRVLNQPRVFHMRIAIVRTAGGGGQRSGNNTSAPGTAQPPLPPQPEQTLSTTIATPSNPPEAVTQALQTTEATTTTTTEATTSAPTSSSVPDTSSADATTEVGSTSTENASEESTTELPSSSSSASEAVSL